MNLNDFDMRHFTALLTFVILSVFTTACEGPEGPPGLDGNTLLGQTMEFQASFNANNNFSHLFVFPNQVRVYESDAVLVYLLEETFNSNGSNTDVWTPLPQSFFTDQGLLQYTFNHTFLDVNLLLQGNFNLNNAAPIFTQNQIFRVVVMPAEFALDPNLNTMNYQEVSQYLGAAESSLIKVGNQE
tara:strand:+ start:5195 stop:5749 length:555 start_codon:yes stop_codon:yes gene_type:complete